MDQPIDDVMCRPKSIAIIEISIHGSNISHGSVVEDDDDEYIYLFIWLWIGCVVDFDIVGVVSVGKSMGCFFL